MATTKDLTDWVDLHPDDHEQRWWLAKKLYKSSEYEAALEHLLILKTRWKPKLNVVRYRAATYYRLGKYPEAIAELEGAVEEWPDEIPVREQLARVLEIAGRKEGAATAWQNVLKLKPGYAIAEQALARLPRLTPPPRETPPLRDADFGIGFGSGHSCAQCGALNTEEREHCWKCEAPLYDSDGPVAEVAAPPPEDIPAETEDEGVANGTAIWNAVGQIGIAVMLALGIFLSLRQYTVNHDTHVAHTAQQFYSSELLLTRLAIGIALLLGWPIALWAALKACRSGDFTLKPVVVTGVLFAALTYLTLSLPLTYVDEALILVLLLSLGPILLVFGMDFGHGLLVWFVQSILVCAVALIAFGAMEGAVALREFPAVLRYAGSHDKAQPGAQALPKLNLPAEATIRWEPTGSKWLDDRAGRVEFVFTNATTSKTIHVELRDEYGAQAHEETITVPFRFQAKVVPGRVYKLSVTGTEGTTVEGSVSGALTARFEL